jgi:hypothetical protein
LDVQILAFLYCCQKGLYEMVHYHVAKSIYPVKDLIFVIKFLAINIPKFEGRMLYLLLNKFTVDN